MDNTHQPDRLLEWGLGTFHTIFFILVLIIPIYFSGTLGSILESLNILIGFAVFTVLWGTTWWTTHRALQMLIQKQSYGLVLFERPFKLGRALSLGLLWGGINGALFSLVLLVVLAISLSPAAFVYALIVIPAAFLLGALSGIILAFIDGILLILARTVSGNFISLFGSERVSKD